MTAYSDGAAASIVSPGDYLQKQIKEYGEDLWEYRSHVAGMLDICKPETKLLEGEDHNTERKTLSFLKKQFESLGFNKKGIACVFVLLNNYTTALSTLVPSNSPRAYTRENIKLSPFKLVSGLLSDKLTPGDLVGSGAYRPEIISNYQI